MTFYSDEELALLQQPHYLDSGVAIRAGLIEINDHECKIVGGAIEPSAGGQSVGEYLSLYDEEALAALESAPPSQTFRASQTGQEWANTIRALKSNEKLSNLQINEVMVDSRSNINLAIVYTDPNQVCPANPQSSPLREPRAVSNGLIM